jgi:hypothetical protein
MLPGVMQQELSNAMLIVCVSYDSAKPLNLYILAELTDAICSLVDPN